MSEEIKNSGMELNEAALEQVGGGFALSNNPKERAMQLCGECRSFGNRRAKCSGSVQKLTQHQEQHGNLENYWSCPFRG